MEKYRGVCCNCSREFYTPKSNLQRQGYDEMGYYICPRCGEFLHLQFNRKDSRMDTTPWEEYIKTYTISILKEKETEKKVETLPEKYKARSVGIYV